MVEFIEVGIMLIVGIKNVFERGIGNLINIGVGKVVFGFVVSIVNVV